MKKRLFVCEDCGHEFEPFKRSISTVGKAGVVDILPWIVVVLSQWFINKKSKTSIECPKCKSNNVKMYH